MALISLWNSGAPTLLIKNVSPNPICKRPFHTSKRPFHANLAQITSIFICFSPNLILLTYFWPLFWPISLFLTVFNFEI